MQSVLGIQCDEANDASAICYERIQYPTKMLFFAWFGIWEGVMRDK